MINVCPSCGLEVVPGATFCGNCGARTGVDMQQRPGGMPPQPPPPPPSPPPPPFSPGRPPVQQQRFQQQQGIFRGADQQKRRMDVRLLGLLGLLALILVVSGVLYATGVFSKETPSETSTPSDQEPSDSTVSSDTTLPVITGISANVSTSAATIIWTTDEPSTSEVEYGTASGYGNTTGVDDELVTSHSASISGLESGTTYHYRVKAVDKAGNKSISGDMNFMTIAIVIPPKLEVVQHYLTVQTFGGGSVLSTISGSVENAGEDNIWSFDVVITVKYKIKDGSDEEFEETGGLTLLEPGNMKPGEEREFTVVIAEDIEPDYEVSVGLSPSS